MTDTVVDINHARSALSFALNYTRLGWFVLPLDPGTKKPLGKAVHNGFHDASNEADTISRWWKQWPDAGIGIALKRSGLVAVDIDPRNGGIETIDQLEATHGPISSDVLAFTGGGGEHRVFSAALVESLPGKLGPGVDLKADGYIAVEPTLHPSGKRYQWEASSDPLDGVVPSTLPTWIRDLGRAAFVAPATVAPLTRPVDPTRWSAVQAALLELPSDDREHWVKVGAAIHNEAPTQEGFDLWDTWSQTSPKYDAQDQLRVWRSFKRKGLAGVGLNTVFAMAQLVGWKNPGVTTKVTPPMDLVLTVQQLHTKAGSVRWAVKHVVPERGIGFIYGASGAFKSFVALDYALHRAYGLQWLGRKTKQATPVYLAAEGGAGLMRRIEAWHKARNLDWRLCPMRVVIVPLTLRTQALTLCNAIRSIGITCGDLIVDTMSQTFTGNENSNDEVAEFLRVLGVELRDALECTVTVVHHSGHSASERPRGASAIIANVDFAFGVFRDEKELLATVEFVKIKDAERPEAQTFSLKVQELGRDEDGDIITSLYATHINNAAALIEAHQVEAAAGRGGRVAEFKQLLQTGMSEKDLRLAFYKTMGDKDPDAKKHAYYRARDAAMRAGAFEFGKISGQMGRVVIVLGDDK